MSNPNKPILSLDSYSLEDAIRLLKNVQLIIKDKYRADMEIGHNKYFINVYMGLGWELKIHINEDMITDNIIKRFGTYDEAKLFHDKYKIENKVYGFQIRNL